MRCKMPGLHNSIWEYGDIYSRLSRLSAARGFGTRFSHVGPTMVIFHVDFLHVNSLCLFKTKTNKVTVWTVLMTCMTDKYEKNSCTCALNISHVFYSDPNCSPLSKHYVNIYWSKFVMPIFSNQFKESCILPLTFII